MFSVIEVPLSKGMLQYRTENLTGIRCRISPDRLNRHLDNSLCVSSDSTACPFCPGSVFSATPTFPDGSRIVHGESVTFPNLYPFGKGHVVTVITSDHFPQVFTSQQIADALTGQIEALGKYDGYPSINWNYLPSSGASLVHPHLQGLSDPFPSCMADRYIRAGREYFRVHGKRYWDALRETEQDSDRYLFGNEISWWSANAVPVGEREIRGFFSFSSLSDMADHTGAIADGILKILDLYRSLGTHAFNMSIFFDKGGCDNGFCAFCSLISRINPNPSSTSDSAFMERLHFEPVILTLPEDLGRYYRNELAPKR